METFQTIEIPDEIVGERIVVRRYRRGDGASLFEAVRESLEHLEPWMPWVDGHTSPEASEAMIPRWIAKWELREDFGMRIDDRDTGRFLGGTGLHRIDWSVPSFEIGYWIRPDAEGKGYVSDAVRLLTRLAFDTLGAKRVFIRCDVTNSRSIAVAERTGYRWEGTLRNSVSHKGELRTMNIYGMIPEEWQAICNQTISGSSSRS